MANKSIGPRWGNEMMGPNYTGPTSIPNLFIPSMSHSPKYSVATCPTMPLYHPY
jgi:hypothetical protein